MSRCTDRRWCDSSRFGKFTKVVFETREGNKKTAAKSAILGSYIDTYLLEKSRIVHQARPFTIGVG